MASGKQQEIIVFYSGKKWQFIVKFLSFSTGEFFAICGE